MKTSTSSFRHRWQLQVDGASRNNPGNAGAGFAILKDGVTAHTHGFWLGTKTNNQAEYLALIIGLIFLGSIPDLESGDGLLVISDSKLLVKQIQGEYRVKNEELQHLHAVAQALLGKFSYTIVHVLRKDNAAADRLANIGIDRAIRVPDFILAKLHEHTLSL